jgi:fido (protein-threonine AMPylation protein)
MSPRGRPSRKQVLESLDQARTDLMIIGGLPEPTVFQDVWAGIWTEETHHSTAIEGNTLRLRQIQLLLEDNLVSGSSHELREWLEAKAYGEAAKWVYELAYQDMTQRNAAFVSEALIRQIHKQVVETVWVHFPPEGLVRGEKPGSYRLKDHDPLRPGLYPLPSTAVPGALQDWVARANTMADGENGAHVIEEVAKLHAAFERIHPFPDGNGRAGRLVLTALLVRLGYPPAIIHKDERRKYLRALERADDGDAAPLGELLARSVRDGIYRFLMPALAGPLSVVPLAALAESEDISRTALLAAAQRGRLHAQKYGDRWYSTARWVQEYKASRQSRREPHLFDS